MIDGSDCFVQKEKKKAKLLIPFVIDVLDWWEYNFEDKNKSLFRKKIAGDARS